MDSIFTFNETGTKLWSLISDGQSSEALAAHLEAEYGLSRSRLRRTLRRFWVNSSKKG